jgi:hypothetical protein
MKFFEKLFFAKVRGLCEYVFKMNNPHPGNDLPQDFFMVCHAGENEVYSKCFDTAAEARSWLHAYAAEDSDQSAQVIECGWHVRRFVCGKHSVLRTERVH